MITGASSVISAQFLNPAQSSATKADGLIFDNVLSGMIKGKEPATSIQEGPPVSAEAEDSEDSADQEATEQGYLNLYPYRILQDGKSTVSVRNFPRDEKAEQTGTWLVSVAEKQQEITDKLDYAVPTVQTPARPEEFETKAHSEHLPLSDATNGTNASVSQAGDQTFTPESIGIREHGEKGHYLTNGDLQRQQGDFSSAESENLFEQGSANSLISDAQVPADELLKDVATMPKEHKMRQTDQAFPLQERLDQTGTAAKTPDTNENKAPLNQGPITRELAIENVVGQKPSKVTASHIEDIQKTIEMQIKKTPVLGDTVVKILLTPDNIGDIHVQLIKTKDSITAVLQVKDAETKGLLDDQLPRLMELFKHSVSQVPIILTVVADPSLAFSFSEGADPGQRKMERQESRKRTAKEKTETKKQPITKQSSRGLSVLA